MTLNEKLFFIICMDTHIKAHARTLEESDWEFIEKLPDRAGFYGFDPRFGAAIQWRLRCIVKHGPKKGVPLPSFDNRDRESPPRKRATRQPYVFDPEVVAMYEGGYSIRCIARLLALSKYNVSRMIMERRLAMDQLWLAFDLPETAEWDDEDL